MTYLRYVLAQVFGLDISDYAIDNAKEEIKIAFLLVQQLTCLGRIMNLILFYRLPHCITFTPMI